MVANPIKPTAVCRNCQKGFRKNREWQVFCSPRCRDSYNNQYRASCFYCGTHGPSHKDHVDPVSRTGKKRDFKVDEWVWACTTCNLTLSKWNQRSIVSRMLFLRDRYIDKLRKMKPTKWSLDEIEELDGMLRQFVSDSLKNEIEIMKRIRFLEVRSKLISGQEPREYQEWDEWG